MMKILHIIAQKPGNTGSGVFLENLMEEGAGLGISQAVIAGLAPEDDILKMLPFDGIEAFPVRFETELLPFPIAGMSDEMPYRSTKFSTFDENMASLYIDAFSEKIREAMEIFKPDAVWIHHLWIAASLACKIIEKTPVILFCHGTELRQLHLAPGFREYVTQGCRKASAVMALTSVQKDELIREYGLKPGLVFVNGTGLKDGIFHPDANSGYNKDGIHRITFAGKLSNAKGVPWLLEAFDNIRHRFDKIQLVVAGSGAGKETEAILEMGKRIGDSVKFAGKISPPEMAELFRKTDVMVLPSFFEGLPLVVPEALACGCRLVATDLPGIREAVPEEMTESGYVKLIPLPPMKTIDVPQEQGLPEFVKNLEKAISDQLNASDVSGIRSERAELIRKKFSWTSLFSRVYEYSERINKKE
ncbi:MAG: glycosyltransferase family 4 protein [Firmicutes bacterium]|nr:glycosyltransferase family 4 protein [Bacillota bacterium]